MTSALPLLGVLTGGYLALTAGLYAGQRRLLYRGSMRRPDPAHAGIPGLRVVAFPTRDGLTLQHWYVPGPSGAPVVVVLHGNAGDIGERAGKYRRFADAGYGLLLVEYRGFGGNPGAPSEAGLLADAESALDWLNAQGVADARIALYGESLGSGVSVAVASERPPAAVMLEAPFTSIPEVAQTHYWYVPAKWLVRDRFDSLARVGGLRAPLLVLHGGRDRTIPSRFGERLFAAAPEPKQWAFYAQANHVDLWDHGAGRAALDFLRSCFVDRQAGTLIESA